MRKPTARVRPSPPAPVAADPDASLTIDGGVARGHFRPGWDVHHVAVYLDGRLLGTAPAQDGNGDGDVLKSFNFVLPPGVFGAVLLVRDTGTGRAILPPYDYTAGREVRWGGWSIDRLTVSGWFEVPAPTPAPLLPVEIVGSSARVTAFAAAEEGPDGKARYSFIGVLPNLPGLQEEIALTATVGGQPVPHQTLAVTTRTCAIAGCIDSLNDDVMIGWAFDFTNPQSRVAVELLADGVVIDRMTAAKPRPDLEALGLVDGRCGFRFILPSSLPRDRTVEIGVVLAGTPTHLTGSPVIRLAEKPYASHFDGVEGPFAGGWAIDMRNPGTPLMVEAVCDNEVIGSGRADLYRGDVKDAGLPTANCGFRLQLDRPMKQLIDRDISVRVVGTHALIEGSPRRVTQNTNVVRFLARPQQTLAPAMIRLLQRAARQTSDTGISIIMPVYNTKRDWLVAAINSVMRQYTPHWELICIDDGSTAPHVTEVLDAAARLDPRIRVLRPGHNGGIARAVNLGLRAARAPYVAFLDHDDVIEPDAVWKLAEAARDTGADLVYSDEAITTEDTESILEVRARGAFSWDYYVSHPYFVHMIAVRTSIAREAAGWDEALPISADVDFVLRVLEASRVVTHVPRVLYRWRTHGESAGHAKQAQVTVATRAAIGRHLVRRALPATVSDGYRFNEYRLDWPDDGGEVLIVIPTKNRVDLLRTCLQSIERTEGAGANIRIVVIDHQSDDPKTLKYFATIRDRVTIMPYSGPFNYAAMNNLAVRTHGGGSRYVLFLNNDVEAIDTGWVERLRSLAGRPDVGAVGPLLLYGDKRVQHAGVLVGFSGAADHAMKFATAYLARGKRNPGYNCNLTTVRDASAVTAACVMMRMDVFQAMQGFDEKFVVGFNDTDLCLRIRDAGYKVLYDGFTLLYHHESATRREGGVSHPEDDVRLRRRWAVYFERGDPFYSPLLAPRGTDHTVRDDQGCKGRMSPRASDPWAKPRRGRGRRV